MEVGNIVDNIEKAAAAIMSDKDQSRFEMASKLDFLTKFLLILMQAYIAIYIVMLRLTLVTAEDIGKGHLAQLESRVDQLDAAGVGFDVDIISARLRTLRETRAQCLRAMMDKWPDACNWHVILSAMDERDSPLIRDIYSTADAMRRAIAEMNRDPGRLTGIHTNVVNHAMEVRGALEKAQWLSNRVLGLSTVRFTSPQNAQPQRRPTASTSGR